MGKAKLIQIPASVRWLVFLTGAAVLVAIPHHAVRAQEQPQFLKFQVGSGVKSLKFVGVRPEQQGFWVTLVNVGDHTVAGYELRFDNGPKPTSGVSMALTHPFMGAHPNGVEPGKTDVTFLGPQPDGRNWVTLSAVTFLDAQPPEGEASGIEHLEQMREGSKAELDRILPILDHLLNGPGQLRTEDLEAAARAVGKADQDNSGQETPLFVRNGRDATRAEILQDLRNHIEYQRQVQSGIGSKPAVDLRERVEALRLAQGAVLDRLKR